MTKKSKNIKPESVVLSNNDIIYLWWTYPKKIKNCLGFSIHRIVDGVEEKKALRATVGFDKKRDERKSPQTTDEWPIQSFNWKDLYAPHNKNISYRIIPMISDDGNWKNLKKDVNNSIVTKTIQRKQEYGSMKIIFNRGLLSTQSFAKKINMENINEKYKNKKSIKEILKLLETDSVCRKRLAGQMLENIHNYFKQKGKFYCALYELSDIELIELLENSNSEIILSNSETNKKSEEKLHEAMENGILKIYDRNMKKNHIGHNKFVVYVDPQNKPKSVLTGSTNWTATG